jgi:hypothetical protein
VQRRILKFASVRVGWCTTGVFGVVDYSNFAHPYDEEVYLWKLPVYLGVGKAWFSLTS